MCTLPLRKCIPVLYLFMCPKLTLYVSNRKIRVHCYLHACVVCIVELFHVRSVLSSERYLRKARNKCYTYPPTGPLQWTVYSNWDMHGPRCNTCTDHLVARTQDVVTSTCVIGFSMIVVSCHFYLPDIPNQCYMGRIFPHPHISRLYQLVLQLVTARSAAMPPCRAQQGPHWGTLL